MRNLFSEIIHGLRDFLYWIGFNEGDGHNEIIFLLLATILGGVYRLGLYFYRRQQQIRLKRDLHPYFSPTDIRKATQYFVPTSFQSNPPSQHSELIQSSKVTARQRLIPFFLNTAFKQGGNDQRFYIVLAGSGMGKTTFMVNLFMRYLNRQRWTKDSFHIRMMPLGYPDLLDRIQEIPDQENTILLLDGLDEDTQAVKNYKKRLTKILNKVKDFRVVVFTCRTQFFPSAEEEPKETGVVRFGSHQGFQTFAKMYLSPFNEKDIHRYLNKKYDWMENGKKRKAQKIILQSPNLMVRPMILSYIDDLLEGNNSYDYTSTLYEVLIRKWIEREGARVGESRREKFMEELYRFSREVAINIYQNRKHRNGLFINEKDINALATKHKIHLEEIEMKSRSLLNRNVLGQYKFAHKSILEFFLAMEAVDNTDFGTHFDFDGMDQARVFYDELCLTRITLPLFKRPDTEATCKLDQNERLPVGTLSPKQIKQIREIQFGRLRQLEPLSPLKRLEKIDVHGTQVKQLGPVIGMPNLMELNLSKTGVEDIRPLKDVDPLQILRLDHCKVADIGPLRSARNLKQLSLDYTLIDELDSLYELYELSTLSFHHTKVRDLNPLRKLRQLKSLVFNHTQVSHISPLRELTEIRSINFSNTKVQNLSPIRTLTQLENLACSYTGITSLKPIQGLTHLSSVKLDNTPISDLSPLEGNVQLKTLSLRKTSVKNLDVLANISSLEKIYLDQNEIGDLNPLKKVWNLREISLRRTTIKSLKALLELERLRKIEVNEGQISQRERKQWQEARPDCEIVVGGKRVLSG